MPSTGRFAFAFILTAVLAAGCGTAEPPASTSVSGPAAEGFRSRPIGSPLGAEERPQIAHVAVADVDRDGLADVLVCDALRPGKKADSTAEAQRR